MLKCTNVIINGYYRTLRLTRIFFLVTNKFQELFSSVRLFLFGIELCQLIFASEVSRRQTELAKINCQSEIPKCNSPTLKNKEWD